jgi:hypothetical protein
MCTCDVPPSKFYCCTVTSVIVLWRVSEREPYIAMSSQYQEAHAGEQPYSTR